MLRTIKKYLLTIVVTTIGIVGGYLYWRFIGCNSGSCPITANWYTSVIAGGLIGYLVGDSINDVLKKKKNKTKQIKS
ncbi:MAG: hypothetical protein JXB24_10695 [Bacteroidales bacterium]|jgi:hypothetical protein|nr:hypothetical protein [Bacteroidales bacterium]